MFGDTIFPHPGYQQPWTLAHTQFMQSTQLQKNRPFPAKSQKPRQPIMLDIRSAIFHLWSQMNGAAETHTAPSVHSGNLRKGFQFRKTTPGAAPSGGGARPLSPPTFVYFGHKMLSLFLFNFSNVESSPPRGSGPADQILVHPRSTACAKRWLEDSVEKFDMSRTNTKKNFPDRPAATTCDL